MNLKKFLSKIFPSRGRVEDEIKNPINWALEVSFLGWLTLVGETDRPKIGRTVQVFRIELGVNLEEVMALEVGNNISSDVGVVSRNSENDENYLQFTAENTTVLIDRRKLRSLARP